MASSIFLKFTLPDSPTWFYFSLFLTVALFYQFTRPLALRNWDLLALFLFAPGSLLVLHAAELSATDQAVRAVVGGSGPPDRASRVRFLGYVWLLGASVYWFGRCLVDLGAVKRPLITPNLSTPGLIWFGGSLFLCFVAVAINRDFDTTSPGTRPSLVQNGEEPAGEPLGSAANPRPTDPRVWVERAFAMGCHLAIVTGLVLIGARRFQDTATGVAAGTLYLLVPYTAFHVGQVFHVWPAVLLVWAIYAFRYPLIAGLLLGIAAGTALFPVFLIPAWTQFYRDRGTGRFLTGAAVAGAVGAVITLALPAILGSGISDPWRTPGWSDWQPWRIPPTESIWSGTHWAYRLPVFIAYLVFTVTTLIWPPVRNLGHLIALSSAALIGVQFWFADRGGLYVLWYAPLLVLMVLRPNLSEFEPGVPGPLPAFLGRSLCWVQARLFGRPSAPPVEVATRS